MVSNRVSHNTLLLMKLKYKPCFGHVSLFIPTYESIVYKSFMVDWTYVSTMIREKCNCAYINILFMPELAVTVTSNGYFDG